MAKKRIIDRLRSPLAFNIFKFTRLPGAWFFGLRIEHFDGKICRVGAPMGWRTQNPFRSIYFAAQLAAGEMSTGLFAIDALDGQPAVSMLVTEVRGEFIKKAASDAVFECIDGEKVYAAVQKALETGEPQRLEIVSEGRLKSTGEVISRITVVWSFKKK